MISQTSRYALRILGYLVENRGIRTRGEQIAEATGIPANYLSKILNQLRKQGLVDSEKGWGGGFELRDSALGTPLQQIMTIFDGVDPGAERQCVFGLPTCDADDPCPLHPYWDRIQQARDEMLTSLSIADLGRP